MTAPHWLPPLQPRLTCVLPPGLPLRATAVGANAPKAGKCFGDRRPTRSRVRQGQAWTLNEAEEIDLALPRKSAAFVSTRFSEFDGG